MNLAKRISCWNSSCENYGRSWVQTKSDYWLSVGKCPSCHGRLRVRPRNPSKHRYTMTSTGEVKRVDEMDSRPVIMVKNS